MHFGDRAREGRAGDRARSRESSDRKTRHSGLDRPWDLAPTLTSGLGCVALASMFGLVGCGSDTKGDGPTDSGAVDTFVPPEDFDPPTSRVLILRLFDPVKRCLMPPTEIGYYRQNPDGSVAACKKQALCYTRPDGIAAYHDEDCVEEGRFLANWKPANYSDLGTCEPLKHALASVKDCPATGCVFARDALIDTSRSCAESLTTKGCRDALPTPTSCYCDEGSKVFVPASSKDLKGVPAGFKECSTEASAACKKALEIVDKVKGCDGPSPPVDAGTDTKTDVASDLSTVDGAGDSSASDASEVSG